MGHYTCDRPGCETEYTVGEDEPTDGMFVSYSVSPHDVDDIDKRAFALCAGCARGLEAALPEGSD
ncbi:hypothetical protein G9C85_02590 [Halorubellus sp. JP-L1]|uniref:hypothetical protein n=1 Tax=Halorubellus sp. JP-L1 TaxID=2715753 RepID=UPI00140A92F4|nr:hypothetical protein [Halorubellus sp. JP-L1]NHN40526.1 hypothetical protein [Halorubellus sp. JP-L1]